MKCIIIGLCVFLCIAIVFATKTSKKNEKLPKSKPKFSKTNYTIDQVDLIVCDHREASFTFRCSFEYAKIDLKIDLEENKRQRICSNKNIDPLRKCKALQFLGCNPEIGLDGWCIDRKVDLEEQKKFWHKSIGQICHKNLVKHTSICKNGRKKIKEGDKHISAPQIQKDYEKSRPKKSTIKPRRPVTTSKPIKVVSVVHETEDPDQILINYIFGKSQFSIKKPDLALFIYHVFKEEKEKPSKPIVLLPKPIFLPPKPIVLLPKPVVLKKPVIVTPKPIKKPSVPYKSKVNSRLTDLLLDYIYGISRPKAAVNELQLFVDYLFEEDQKFIEESILRKTLVELIVGFKPFLELSLPAILPIKPVFTRKPIKPVFTRKPIKPVFTRKPIKHVFTKKPIKPSTRVKSRREQRVTRRPNVYREPLKVEKVTYKPKPTKPTLPVAAPIPRDEFDISFIFKIADELVTPRDRIEYLNAHGESNLKHYKFLLGQRQDKIDESKKPNENEIELENNKIDDVKKIFQIKREKSKAIDDLMKSMGVE